jgi:hypothetical protein
VYRPVGSRLLKEGSKIMITLPQGELSVATQNLTEVTMDIIRIVSKLNRKKSKETDCW